MKRVFDFGSALFGLITLSPVIIVAMLVVSVTSPGSPILAQRRVGRDGKPFTIYKLRTMYVGTKVAATHEVNPKSTTPVGAFLRRSKVDELPQLWNVVRGDMSLVGPRPCLPIQTELVEARKQSGALSVRPGITGLAQVQGVDMSDPQKLAAIDGLYVAQQRFMTDLLLILRTFCRN